MHSSSSVSLVVLQVTSLFRQGLEPKGDLRLVRAIVLPCDKVCAHMDVLGETNFLELGLHLVVEDLWLSRFGSLAAFSTLSGNCLVHATKSACGYSAARLVVDV